MANGGDGGMWPWSGTQSTHCRFNGSPFVSPSQLVADTAAECIYMLGTIKEQLEGDCRRRAAGSCVKLAHFETCECRPEAVH